MALRPLLLRAGGALVLVGLLIVALRSGDLGLAARAALHVSPAALLIALVMTMFSMVLNGVVWTRVLRCMGYQEPAHIGVTVYAGTGLASYAGSCAGAIGGCVMLLRRRGICGGHAALMIGIASMVGCFGALVWAPCGVALLAAPAALHGLPALGIDGPLVAAVAAGLLVGGNLLGLWLITLAPRLGARWRFMRFLVDPAAPPLRLHLHRLLALVPGAAIAWLVGTGPLWVLVHAVAPRAEVSLSAAVAIQALATLGSAMTFFLPNGLGTRDGIIVAMLTGVLGVPLPAAAATAALVRMSDPIGKALILLTLAGLARAHALPLPAPMPWRTLGGAARALSLRSGFGARLSDSGARY